MSIHLHREMENLNRAALRMCAHVEENVRDATRTLLERDADLAKRVAAADRHIDRIGTDLSENCLKAIALYQPVAGDLRFIFSLAKISGILERIGDLAENLAHKGKSLSRLEPVAIPRDLAGMAEQAGAMLKDSIDCFVARDAAKARAVIQADSAVNDGKRAVRRAGEAAIMEKPALCAQWLIVIAASRNIERIGDMAASVAVEVIYGVEGKLAHHGLDCE